MSTGSAQATVPSVQSETDLFGLSSLSSPSAPLLPDASGDGETDQSTGLPTVAYNPGILPALSRWPTRVLRHPRYSGSVLATLLSAPPLLWETLWLGSRQALLRQCLRMVPELTGLFTEYDAGFWGQVFLFDEYELGRLHLPPGAVVLDVGANVGFFSWKVHSALPEARVFAFEPERDNLSRLRKVFATLGIQGGVVPAACSDREGTATLYRHNTVTHPLDPGMHPEIPAEARETVPVTTLDSFCRGQGIDRVDLIKIDVEGLEGKVLRGARRILARTRAVVLEYHSPRRLAQCRDLLEDAGFSCRQKSFWGPPTGQEGLLLAIRRPGGACPAGAEGRVPG